jgi:hypothetical protein
VGWYTQRLGIFCQDTSHSSTVGTFLPASSIAGWLSLYACYSCYNHFGAGKLVQAAADPKQTAITQFFKKQKQ